MLCGIDPLSINQILIFHRYRQLQEPIQIRRDNLEDAALLHRWERDADEEFSW